MQVKEIKEKQQKWMEDKRKAATGGTSSDSQHVFCESSIREDDGDLLHLSVQSNRVEKWLEQNSGSASVQHRSTYQPGWSIVCVCLSERYTIDYYHS